MFLIQDNSTVYNKVSQPAVLFDKDCGTLHKIGEFDNMVVEQKRMTDQYRSHGYNDIADDLIVMELPQDQEVIDKVFNITGYVKRLYDDMMIQKG